MRVTSAVPSRKRRKRALERAKGFYGASSKRIRTVYDAIDKVKQFRKKCGFNCNCRYNVPKVKSACA